MKRFTHEDLDSLRSIRQAYRQILDLLNQWKAEESELRMLIAYSSVFDECDAVYQAVGRALSALERLPPTSSIPVEPILADESGPGAGRSPASRAAASMARTGRAAFGDARGPVIAHAFARMPEPRESSPPANGLSAAQAGRVKVLAKPAIETALPIDPLPPAQPKPKGPDPWFSFRHGRASSRPLGQSLPSTGGVDRPQHQKGGKNRV